MTYLVVIEPTATGFSAYSPDLDGCVATGSTLDEVQVRIQEAITFHVEGLRAEGLEVPAPRTQAAFIDVAA
ncbi:MAG: type II toxin-antitoxin system HicB family antitoxin [Thermoanaerobaculia bacterium]